jgi:hypothetical protein
MNPIAVSSWSLHKKLGYAYENGPGKPAPFARTTPWGAGEITLEYLPAALAAHGFTRIELCHFHLANHDADYLKDVGPNFRKHGVAIQTLLIDDGDITNAETKVRDMAWIARWVHSAAHLGADYARVVAGKQKPSSEALALSVAGLKELSALGKSLGVRVVTENWFDLLATPRDVLHVLDGVGDDLGFLADTGNWRGITKHADLEVVFARAELCHSKAHFPTLMKIDDVDYGACVRAGKRARYSGPHTLIFDNDGDEWEGLALERALVEEVLAE